MSFTVKYAAPETIRTFRRGEETVTAHPSVDVWAFGMICFELLTHQKFYGVGKTADDVLALLESDELLPSEKGLNPHVAGANSQFPVPLRVVARTGSAADFLSCLDFELQVSMHD